MVVAKNNDRPKIIYSAEYWRNARLMRAEFRNGDPCVICGQPILMVNQLSIEHIIAKRNGGSDKRSNLGYAHRRCNYAWNKRKR
jgi:5-methylcytosine-specific restriction endonuclease McrA